ncbi:bile acid:sodium symporter family protein, partial [Staphylococcus arlettae]
LYVLVGESINIDTISILKGLILMIVIPSIFGILVNEF